MITNKAYLKDSIILNITKDDYNAAIKEIENKCTYHHRSLALGYVKRNDIIINRYKGRFGTGFTVHYTNYNSNFYHHIEYYIIKGVDEK